MELDRPADALRRGIGRRGGWGAGATDDDDESSPNHGQLLVPDGAEFTFISAGAYHTCGFAGCPDIDQIRGYIPDEASVILDRDEEEIGRLFLVNRVVVSLDSLPEYVAQAIEATDLIAAVLDAGAHAFEDVGRIARQPAVDGEGVLHVPVGAHFGVFVEPVEGVSDDGDVLAVAVPVGRVAAERVIEVHVERQRQVHVAPGGRRRIVGVSRITA